jgi:hypothetical protein
VKCTLIPGSARETRALPGLIALDQSDVRPCPTQTPYNFRE